MNSRTRVIVRREPFLGDTVDLLIASQTTVNGVTRQALAEPVQFVALEPSEARSATHPLPTLSLHPDEAQTLMDELWRAGLRPTEGQGSAGQLVAVQRHLEDMRTLVFTHPTQKAPAV